MITLDQSGAGGARATTKERREKRRRNPLERANKGVSIEQSYQYSVAQHKHRPSGVFGRRPAAIKQTEMTMTLLRNLSIALAFALPATTYADGDVELVEKMSSLQYFAHKTALALDHKNKELAGFYAHELEEYIEDAATVESYDGHEVGKLINSMLVPAFESFEKELNGGDWKKASKRFDEMLSTCNACHDRTEHGYITIERTSENPFMQSFKAKK